MSSGRPVFKENLRCSFEGCGHEVVAMSVEESGYWVSVEWCELGHLVVVDPHLPDGQKLVHDFCADLKK